MGTKRGIVLGLTIWGLLGTATPALAQLGPGWTGDASLSGSRTSGNTDTIDLGIRLNLKYNAEKWRHTIRTTADFGRANDKTNKQRVGMSYKLGHDLSDRTYIFGNADYFYDDFGPFEEGYFLGGGFGYELTRTDPIQWGIELGLGFRSQSEQSPSPVVSERLAARVASDFDWAFSENVKLYNNTEAQIGDFNTNVWNELGLTSNLIGNLAARISFRAEHNTNPPESREGTDTITRFGLVYKMD